MLTSLSLRIIWMIEGKGLEEKMNIGKINNGTAINNREESTPMKKNHWKWIPLLVIAFGVISACNLIAARTPEPGASDANAIHTQAAQTVIAQLTQAATNITPTMELPTQTTEAPRQAPPPTETPAPPPPTPGPSPASGSSSHSSRHSDPVRLGSIRRRCKCARLHDVLPR